MRSNPEQQLRRVLVFLGLDEVSDGIVREAVEFASFDNMRQMELSQVSAERGKLRARDKDDPESFKSRRRKVGAFVDYLNSVEIEYMAQKINQLSSFYGYSESEVLFPGGRA
jgi:hypothetical protein